MSSIKCDKCNKIVTANELHKCIDGRPRMCADDNYWTLARDPKYVVSKIKAKLQGEDVYVPYIEKHTVLPIVKEMYCDEDRFFSDKYRYDFICKHWSRLEDGYVLEKLAWYMYQYRFSGFRDSDNITAQLKRQLKKQMDKDGYIIVYRGFNDYTNEEGHSYTLSRNVAIWFSRRFSEEISYVNTYKIHVEDVMAFITNRGEAEIIASPDAVILLETNSYSDKVKISHGCKVEFINN